MPSDPPNTAAAPKVTERTFAEWGIRNGDGPGAIMFGGESREDVERRMLVQAKRLPNAVLITREIHERIERIETPIAVVPWHSPCDWIAEGDESGKQIGPSWCMAHKHGEGTPVPAEHIRGAS